MVVIPQLVKVSYVVGGAGGSGVLLVRDPATRQWSAPAFYTSASGSIGFQIGASASEGPLGVSSHSATTTTLDVDVLSYARSKGPVCRRVVRRRGAATA